VTAAVESTGRDKRLAPSDTRCATAAATTTTVSRTGWRFRLNGDRSSRRRLGSRGAAHSRVEGTQLLPPPPDGRANNIIIINVYPVVGGGGGDDVTAPGGRDQLAYDSRCPSSIINIIIVCDALIPNKGFFRRNNIIHELITVLIAVHVPTLVVDRPTAYVKLCLSEMKTCHESIIII